MCECLKCGAVTWCVNPACTNDECQDCRELREEMDACAAVPDIDPAEECLPDEGEGRR
jgi:hypothetical protein